MDFLLTAVFQSLAVLSLCLVYLLFLSSDNYILRTRIDKIRARANLTEVEDAPPVASVASDDTKGPDEYDDSDLMELFNSSTLSFFVLRPHYSLFVAAFNNVTGEKPVALWLASPWALYLLLGAKLIRPSSMLFAYVGLMIVLRLALVLGKWVALLRRLRSVVAALEWQPRRWMRGVAVRAGVLLFLSLQLTAEQWLSPVTVQRVESLFVLVFVLVCFMTGRSYLALLWALLVSSVTSAIPFFRSTFSIVCPWSESGLCPIQIGRFFVASEFLLLVASLPRITIQQQMGDQRPQL